MVRNELTRERERSGDCYGADLYTEAPHDVDTLHHLGPLAPLAGRWQGARGRDVHPFVAGIESDTYVERYDLRPIDAQTNGPQLFYGLRYHTHVTKIGEVETFHDQVGYWLWEPEAGLVTFSLSSPRGQVLLASGSAAPDAKSFEVRAAVGEHHYGILSNPFLDRAFRTVGFRMYVTIHDDGTWSYEEETDLVVEGTVDVIAHTDRNTLSRIGAPVENPMFAHHRGAREAPRR
ncbi:MAG: FABP family protein [Acidobacteria bacterium]|nr:FABP family protein [Acidobacteriota bacterium]